MPNRPSPRSPRTSWRGLALGLMAGAALGGTGGFAVASALGSGEEGAGYGGTANALQVQVVGEQVHVSGVGFMALSPVTVKVGDLSAEVTADEFGRVDAAVSADGVGASDAAVATGQAVDGTARALRPLAARGDSRTTATLLGVGLGAVPVAMSRRKYRRAR
jgi:hypothetical protein